MIPNMLAEVQRCQHRNPQAWANAHTGNAQTEDFIRLLASDLHAIDARFGLNGKRGNPNDISDDAINYLGEGPGHDPISGLPVTVFDVIRRAGGSNPEASWDRINEAGPGAWVSPVSVKPPVPQPPAIPSYEAIGGDAFFRSNIGVPLQADMALVGQTLNDGSSVWFSRTTHSLMAALMGGGAVDTGAIVKKHRNEWRGVLGLPPL